MKYLFYGSVLSLIPETRFEELRLANRAGQLMIHQGWNCIPWIPDKPKPTTWRRVRYNMTTKRIAWRLFRLAVAVAIFVAVFRNQ